MRIEDAVKQSQERSINAIEAVKSHKIADKYYEVIADECHDLYSRGVAASLMNNFAKVMDSEKGINFTTTSDFGPYVMEVWPLVTAWYPEFPLKDLISVQDMDKPLAYLFFSCLKTGTNKADTVAGELVETATGSRSIRGRYPTGEIFGETIEVTSANSEFSAGAVSVLLAYAPLNVSTVAGYLSKVLIKATEGGTEKTYVAKSVEGGKVILALQATPTVDSGNYIDVQTGLVVLQAASATTVTRIVANYVWNLDHATVENIQRVKEQVEMVPVEATPRALMLEWTLFSEYLKKSQFGQDIRQDNTKRILSLMYQYQTRYILDEMYDYATGNNATAVTVNIPSSTAISLDVKAQNVMQTLKNAANIIEIASGRVEGNRIVCGKNFKSFVESLPTTWFKQAPNATDYGFSSPREIGEFGTFKVYYDPTREANEAFMTYRGSEWYDASYYLGEYMPIVPTEAIALGVKVRSSFVSMEAYKFHKPNCVVKLNFVNA